MSEKKRYYAAAGVCLGLNVMVRFPNLVEASLILAVWFCWVAEQRKNIRYPEKTGLWSLGYLQELEVFWQL